MVFGCAGKAKLKLQEGTDGTDGEIILLLKLDIL